MPAKPANSATVNETTLELEADRTILIRRTFNAPAHLLFQAWTKAEFVRRWWAPRSLGVTMASCDADVRVGGSYRYVLSQETGEKLAFSGTYREVSPPDRLVYTQRFEPMGDAEVVVTITLSERDGKTELFAREVYPSAEARDAALASGMEHGMRDTMNQLEELLASLL